LAETQADRWANTRARYGTLGRYISERDASRFAEALDLLAPHGASIVDAAKHYAGYLSAEKLRASSKPTADALREWVESYTTKDRDPRTRLGARSMARIFSRAFGELKLRELTPALLLKWIEEYEAKPGKPAAPQTRQNLKTKFSQFLNFSKLKGWIENNPLEGIKLERPPRTAVAILEISQVRRILSLTDAHEERAIVLPYAAICFFAGLRPSEAEQLSWKDINFSTGDIHVRAETSKTREERFVPMEANLRAWLESCPVRQLGPIIGTIPGRFRFGWEKVRRDAGFKVGPEPDDGWPALAQDWPSDSPRHTYASMWLAIHKSRAELAEHMGNSETVIRQHYRRAIREDVARSFWAIMPKSAKRQKILRMEKAA